MSILDYYLVLNINIDIIKATLSVVNEFFFIFTHVVLLLTWFCTSLKQGLQQQQNEDDKTGLFEGANLQMKDNNCGNAATT